jgi:hypothetical protein
MKIESEEHVSNITDIVRESNYEHRDAGKTRDLARVLDLEWIDFSARVLDVG